jgi:hypothetical protein
MYGELGHHMKSDWIADRHGIKPDGVPKSDMINTTGLETCALAGKDLYCWGNGIADPQKVNAVAGSNSVSMAMAYHCTNINGMLLCWDENRYLASVQNASWKMSASEFLGLENVQALELGVGQVSTVAAGDAQSCAVVDLASGSQELYCWSLGEGFLRVEAFDHLNPVQYAPPTGPDMGHDNAPLSQHEKDVLCAQKMGISQDQFDQIGPHEMQALRKMCGDQSQEVEAYKHPVKCAGKRVLKGLLLGPFANGDC